VHSLSEQLRVVSAFTHCAFEELMGYITLIYYLEKESIVFSMQNWMLF